MPMAGYNLHDLFQFYNDCADIGKMYIAMLKYSRIAGNFAGENLRKGLKIGISWKTFCISNFPLNI